MSSQVSGFPAPYDSRVNVTIRLLASEKYCLGQLSLINQNKHLPSTMTLRCNHVIKLGMQQHTCRDVFSAAARQTVALVLLRHSKDLFLPFTEDENERQQPTDSRLPPPHVLVPASEYLYRSELIDNVDIDLMFG